MNLSPSVKAKYTQDDISAREAQRLAEFIAFSPVVFQISRLMVKLGVLDLLRNADNGMTQEEIAAKTGLSLYAVKVLTEASLSIGTVIVDAETNRFYLAKTGWFLLNDPATKVNLDFNHDVNYMGMFRLEEALKEGIPAGLKHFGDWPTIYEGLSSLPADVQKSWFAFDHFYSDSSFEEALKIVFADGPQTLLDVGGNTGRWALRCVGYNADVNVTVVDLPQQLEMMKAYTQGKNGAERIDGYGMNLLDDSQQLPTGKHYDVIWMSQFLDCFNEEQVTSILRRAARIMDANTRLYIMETVWDRQRFEPAAFCLTMTSVYFTAMANGNSKMFNTDDLVRLIGNAGMEVEQTYDCLGQAHTILKCKTK